MNVRPIIGAAMLSLALAAPASALTLFTVQGYVSTVDDSHGFFTDANPGSFSELSARFIVRSDLGLTVEEPGRTQLRTEGSSNPFDGEVRIGGQSFVVGGRTGTLTKVSTGSGTDALSFSLSEPSSSIESFIAVPGSFVVAPTFIITSNLLQVDASFPTDVFSSTAIDAPFSTLLPHSAWGSATGRFTVEERVISRIDPSAVFSVRRSVVQFQPVLFSAAPLTVSVGGAQQGPDITLVAGGGGQVFIVPEFPRPLGPPPAVPEPQSWALFIAGFGLVGALRRRRRAFAPS